MGDFDITYESFKTGERQGSATSVQLPEYAGKLVVIRALDSNAGNVYMSIIIRSINPKFSSFR